MSLQKIVLQLKVYLRGILYSLQYCIQLSSERRRLTVMTSEETVRKIIHDRCSICRFGDGELDMITSLSEGYDVSRKSNFQKYDALLAERLQEVLKFGYDRDTNILVCIPYVWKDSSSMKKVPRRFVRRSFVNNINMIRQVVSLFSEYGDSYFTRFYIDFKDKNKGNYIRFVKKIWDCRDVCIIEGEQSRLGVGNDLFDNVSSLERILCPAENAFSRYNEILSVACQIPHDKMVLIALGQTATVLAYDLAKLGYQAIDLGHIDVEYEWFLMQAEEKVALPNKFVNEVEGGRRYTDELDAKYLAQIIYRVN